MSLGGSEFGGFVSDDAQDWVVEFQEAPSAHLLDDAFTVVIRANGYVERDLASYALVAAEIVAAASGKPCKDIPVGLREWAADHPWAASAERRAHALQAIEAVRRADRSELAELWVEPRYVEDWLARTATLKERVR